MKFEKLKAKIYKDLKEKGTLQPIPRYAPHEILNYSYSFENMKCDVSDEEEQYIKDKLSTYSESLQRIITMLKWNKSSRQAVIQFEQPEILPNCTVSLHFQIRKETLYLNVFQRSQDIEKLRMDCEIFNRMSQQIIDARDDIKFLKIFVFVGNMHKFTFNEK